MARLDFDAGTERDEMFRRIGSRNRVGRKHNHQPRGRSRERQKRALEMAAAHKQQKIERFHQMVAAYWRGEIDAYPDLKLCRSEDNG